MARSNVSRFRTNVGRSRRLTAWGIGPEVVNGFHSATVNSVWTTGVVPGAEGFTIARIRGFIHYQMQSGAAAGDGFFGAAGIGLVTDEAFAIGATAMPDPLSDNDWEGWIWHSFFDVRVATGTFADAVNASGVSQRLEIDSKAMRKFPVGWTLFGMTAVTESGAASVEVNGDTRVLIKLS